jgi:hypothetical protein
LLEQCGWDNEVFSLGLGADDTPVSEYGVHRLRRMLPHHPHVWQVLSRKCDFVGFLWKERDGAMYSKIGMQVAQIFIC